MSTAQVTLELEELAQRIRRIRAVGRNGDADPFYEDRSQAAADCTSLAEWHRTGRRPTDYVLAADRPQGGDRRNSYRQR